ncbi:MAG: protein kinase [Pyrinomonadaceae bacterium]|nr:protein kinase [Pyrinomonadaceae bacterium]
MKLKPDTTISHYKILSEIGKGGMGEVYLAQDTELDRKVAIKFLSDEFVDDSDKLNRFVQEAKAASALNHPNIITIHQIGKTDDTRFIALEYIEGETLTERLKNKLKFNEALDIATQIASALDAAHAAGIVHRDIKPDNVMIREDGIVKILDFGIAKLMEQEKPDLESEDKTAVQVNTTPGMIIGTANYMSPEQAKGKEVDSRTDIFSFGVLLYEMVSGRLPFEGDSPLEIIGSILKDEPKPLGNATVPPEISRIILKTLRKDPDERYQTIKGLLGDLNDVKAELEFQEKLDKTVQPNRAEPETQMFKGATAAETQKTTQSEQSNDSISIKRSSFGKILAGIVAILVVSAVGFGYWFLSGDSSDQINSIAVMPFVNESGNEEVEYLSDGMTETLISSLSNIPNLSVKARSTVFFYKGKNVSPKTIGEELNVQAILLGRIVQRGEEIKLSLELVDTQTQDVIWSDQFSRKTSALITLQSEIAKQVAQKINSRLSGAEQKKIAKSYTNNPVAYQAYVKGRFHWNRRTVEGLQQGIVAFQEAIKIDPSYALAWSGLADSYFLLPEYGSFAAKEYLPKAKEAAQKAIELDPNLAEAQTSMAYIDHSYDWKFSEAERRYKKAIELNPNYATAYQWYGELLSQQKRFEEAESIAKKSVELDPLSLIKNSAYAGNFFNAREYAKSEAHHRKVLEINPDFALANINIARCLVAQGKVDEALNRAKKASRLGGESYRFSEGLIYAAAGDKTNANRFVSEYKGLVSQEVSDLAILYALLGEDEKAIDGFEILIEQRSVFVLYNNIDPSFDRVRKNPRYVVLAKRVGLNL